MKNNNDPFKLNVGPVKKKSNPVLARAIIAGVIVIALGCYFWWVAVRNKKEEAASAGPTYPSSVTSTQALPQSTTTPEQDLSNNVLNGTDYSLTTGIK